MRYSKHCGIILFLNASNDSIKNVSYVCKINKSFIDKQVYIYSSFRVNIIATNWSPLSWWFIGAVFLLSATLKVGFQLNKNCWATFVQQSQKSMDFLGSPSLKWVPWSITHYATPHRNSYNEKKRTTRRFSTNILAELSR